MIPDLHSHSLPAWSFTLYILNESPGNRQVYQNLITLCESYLPDSYTIDTVYISTSPEEAEKNKILALPTLIRENPLPKIRIVGDLSNGAEAAKSLDLNYFHSEFVSDHNLAEQRKMLLVSVQQMIDSYHHITKLLSAESNLETVRERDEENNPGLLKIFTSIVNSAKRIITLENNLLRNHDVPDTAGIIERREHLLVMIEEKKKSSLQGIAPLDDTINYIEKQLHQEFNV